MTAHIFSFSYKLGLPSDLGPDGGGFVFDCRALPNPFWVENLRGFTGRDQPIIDFFAARADAVAAFLKPVEDLARNSIAAYAQDARERLSVGFGCTGGGGQAPLGLLRGSPGGCVARRRWRCGRTRPHGTPNRLVVKTKIQW